MKFKDFQPAVGDPKGLGPEHILDSVEAQSMNIFRQALEEAKSNPRGNTYDYVPVISEIPAECPDIPNPTAYIKLFTPQGSWTWLLLGYDRESKIAFVYAYDAMYPYFAELGSLDVGELETIVGPGGIPAVERDFWFEPMPLKEAVRKYCPGVNL